VSRELLDKYCQGCHNARSKVGGLALDGLDPARAGADAEVWEKVIRKLRAGVMPPAGRPRPDTATLQTFISAVEDTIDRAGTVSPHPGRTPAMHRLNRAEYANAIRDILGLEIDGKAMLPGDSSGYGFDNIAELLSVSPGLMDRYMLAASQIARLAVGDSTLRPAVSVYKVPYNQFQDERAGDDLPFGSRGGASIRHYFPLDGEYSIGIRLQRNSISVGNQIRGLDVQNLIDLRVDRQSVKLFTLDVRDFSKTYGNGDLLIDDTADQALTVRVPIKAGIHEVGVSLNKSDWYTEGVGISRLPPASGAYETGLKTDKAYGRIDMGIDRIEIAGPFDGGSSMDSLAHRRVFTCRPDASTDEASCGRAILSALAQRAYRRPVNSMDLKPVLSAFEDGRSRGGFETGVQRGIERILVDPSFLFRVERDPTPPPPGGTYRISDIELASRLSFFLWSSVPDVPLLNSAIQGRLHEPPVLEQQVRRMLTDDRAAAFRHNFFGQWLYLRNLDTQLPDAYAFANFDENLRGDFKRETELFIESQIHEDRSALELLTANYTFVNERLARHYGIPNIYGDRFRRVTLPGGRRAGILGQGSILTVTSYANRTSPVFRGKWLLENILGTPPPPPPPNVPDLKDDAQSQATSMRARMEQHRKNPICASCHSMLDPLGFALENFDGVGQWRDADGGAPVDASGKLPDGTKFNGPEEFRAALMSDAKEAYVTTLTEKLLTYALGRGTEYFDMPAVRQILREAAPQEYRWSKLITGIVTSVPFQFRAVNEVSDIKTKAAR
jgi:hypothetical protein